MSRALKTGSMVHNSEKLETLLGDFKIGNLKDVILTGLADNYILYYNQGATEWRVKAESAGGSTTFLSLTDTPGTFVSGKILKVNAGGDALELVDETGGTTTFLGLTDVSGDYVGQRGKFLQVNSTEDAVIFADRSEQNRRNDVSSATFDGTSGFTHGSSGFVDFINDPDVILIVTDGSVTENVTVSGNATSGSFTINEDLSGSGLSTTADAITVTAADWEYLARDIHGNDLININPAGELVYGHNNLKLSSWKALDETPDHINGNQLLVGSNSNAMVWKSKSPVGIQGYYDTSNGYSSKTLGINGSSKLTFPLTDSDPQFGYYIANAQLRLQSSDATPQLIECSIVTLEDLGGGNFLAHTDLSPTGDFQDAATGINIHVNSGTAIVNSHTGDPLLQEDYKGDLTWGDGQLVRNLLSLNEVPDTLGTSGQLLAVNVGEDALEFINPTSGGSTDFISLTDTPAVFGNSGQLATVNEARNALEFTDKEFTQKTRSPIALVTFDGTDLFTAKLEGDFGPLAGDPDMLVQVTDGSVTVYVNVVSANIVVGNPDEFSVAAADLSGSGLSTVADAITVTPSEWTSVIKNNKGDDLLVINPDGQLVHGFSGEHLNSIFGLKELAGSLGTTGQALVVNGAGDALEFVTLSTGASTLEALGDTPVGYGNVGQILVVNGSQDGLEYVDQEAQKFIQGWNGGPISGLTVSGNTGVLTFIANSIDLGGYAPGGFIKLETTGGALVDSGNISNIIDNGNGTSTVVTDINTAIIADATTNVTSDIPSQLTLAENPLNLPVVRVDEQDRLINHLGQVYINSGEGINAFDNVNAFEDVSTDGHALTWNNSSGEYELTNVAASTGSFDQNTGTPIFSQVTNGSEAFILFDASGEGVADGASQSLLGGNFSAGDTVKVINITRSNEELITTVSNVQSDFFHIDGGWSVGWAQNDNVTIHKVTDMIWDNEVIATSNYGGSQADVLRINSTQNLEFSDDGTNYQEVSKVGYQDTISTMSTTRSILSSEYTLAFLGGPASQTFTLPALASVPIGRKFVILNGDITNNFAFNLAGNGAEIIDSKNTWSLAFGSSVTIMSVGTMWFMTTIKGSVT